MSMQRPGLDFAFGSPGSSRDISLAIFYALRNRPAVDLRCLLRECERRLDDAGWCAAERSDAQTLAVDGIRAFADAHEQRLPTSKEYEVWRKSPEAPAGLPSEPSVRRAFGGSWKLAVRAAEGGGPVDVVAARQLRAQGPAYSPEELRQALRDFAAGESVEVARWKDYRRWVTGALERDPDRRLPSSRHSFRTLGGFRAACRSVGLRTLACGLSPDDCRYEERDRIAALRRAWEECERPARLTKTQYEERRLAWQQAAIERGRPTAFPAATTLVARYDGWAKALAAAEVMDLDTSQRVTKSQRTKHIETEVGLRFLIDAMTEKGLSLGPSAYDAWHSAHPRYGESDGPPSRGWFWGRFGSFGAACEQARARLREERDERSDGDEQS